VGLERPVSRAISARETGPRRRIVSSADRSLIARSRLGVPAENVFSIGLPPSVDSAGSSHPAERLLTPATIVRNLS